MTALPEHSARRILETAIAEQRASELLEALFDGGTASVSPGGRLVILPADQLATLVANVQAIRDRLPDGWGDPATPENAERIAQWVWCPVVHAVLSDDGCEFDKVHERNCPCGSRFRLAVGEVDR